MYHDVSVADTTYGNVFRNGFGDDLCFDHHKSAPWANLYANIRTGKGGRPFMSGGGSNMGPFNGGIFNTFWNVYAQDPMPLPHKAFAPLMNFIGYWRFWGPEVGTTPAEREDLGWVTDFTKAVGELSPNDLYVAMIKLRMADPTSWNIQEKPAASRRLLSWDKA